MPTFAGPIENRRVLLHINVKLPQPPGSSDPPTIHAFVGLFDTGATRTMVSQTVVDEVGAPACGVADFGSASGEVTRTTVHLLDLSIPVTTGVAAVPEHAEVAEVTVYASGLSNVPVLLLPKPLHEIDIVLGMDLIACYHTTICMGNFILSN